VVRHGQLSLVFFIKKNWGHSDVLAVQVFLPGRLNEECTYVQLEDGQVLQSFKGIYTKCLLGSIWHNDKIPWNYDIVKVLFSRMNYSYLDHPLVRRQKNNDYQDGGFKRTTRQKDKCT